MTAEKTRRDEKFTAIYRAYVDEIYQYLYLRTGASKTIAEDLTQEIFLAVYQGLPKFKGAASERTWVFQITKNRLNDFYRRQCRPLFEQVRLDEMPDAQLTDVSQDAQASLLKAFEQETVRACLSALPKQYEIVLTMKYVDERSTKEIAAFVGKSPKAIERLLRRAKDAFIHRYAQEEEGGRSNESERSGHQAGI